jgi:Ca2+:H+ antiporter
MPIHATESGAIPPTQPSPAVLANWRNNIPDEPFLKRIGERMSSRFMRGEQPASTPTTDRHGSTESTGNGSARRNTQENAHLAALPTALTSEDTNLFVRNVAEVAAAAATLAIHNSQSPTPQVTPRIPPPQPLSTNIESTPKGPRGRVSQDWDADLAEAEMHGGGGHDAPNWSRTKSSMILLGATILYAIIAGIPYGRIKMMI